ncbi:hypothetical protein [Nostoc sp. UHCC 0252]|uniref:hypothetical protein n=1 Tax=Nostoc sp. UHCC 0252 TaxID=3110241 RepID=UPI002B1F9E97|nr:hypothetical protein [Nostoc sp. UHCC 0252]MEA5604808.1 hypothetical protein [Nostoc sp. UHCC 0252]
MDNLNKILVKFRRKPNTPWKCTGEGRRPHAEYINHSDECDICGSPRPDDKRDEPKLRRDKNLLAALTVLNVVSGFTTIIGTVQIFPGLVGYISGATIQGTLFLLLSGSAAKHAPKLKWLTIASFSIISVYTSFFAYYDTLTSPQSKKSDLNKALAAHQESVSNVYSPLRKRVTDLEGEISALNNQIPKEEGGQGVTGLVGHGTETKKLIEKRNQLEIELNKLKPTVDSLQKVFNYETKNKSPEDILQADIKALGAVPKEYLPKEYSGNLESLRKKYLDVEESIKVLAPYYKLKNGEIPAIAALLIAVMVDGLIISLGTAVEIKQQEVSLRLKGSGSNFLDEFLNAIDEATGSINSQLLQKTNNPSAYILLLQNIRLHLGWVNNNQKEWKIRPQNSNQLVDWLITERERQLRKEGNKVNKQSHNSSQERIVKFQLPPRG